MALLENMLVLTKHSQQNMFNTSKRCVLCEQDACRGWQASHAAS